MVHGSAEQSGGALLLKSALGIRDYGDYGITVTVHFIRDDIGSFVIQRIEKCTITRNPRSLALIIGLNR
jgi:hypothetical protein